MRLSIAILLAATTHLAAQTPTEKAIIQQVDARNAEGVALLERLVNINSGTLNLPGVRAVGAVLRSELDALGFITRWEDGAGYQRAGHLIAAHSGQGPRLLLIGHLDTVFDPDSPFQRFERVDSSHARGPGTSDMKGGDVIIVQALKALQAQGALDRMNITIVFHGDEEDAGKPQALARRTLIEAAHKADIAIGFEDGDGDPTTAVIARRGYTGWTLTSTGTPAHSSQIFREDIGAGAIYETARVLQTFRERLTGDPLLTFNPGVALGGTTAELDSTAVRGTAAGKGNVIAAKMVVTGDLRAISAARLAETKAAMQAIVADHLPHTTSTIVFEDGYPPMAPTEGNRRLLAVLDLVSRDLGQGPVGIDNPARAGAADVSFVAGIVPMVIDGLGLAGSGGHTDKEVADISELPKLTKRAAILFYRLTQPARP